MDGYRDIAARLEARLAELAARVDEIEDDLRQPLDDDSEERASERADDEALEGVDDVLRAEAALADCSQHPPVGARGGRAARTAFTYERLSVIASSRSRLVIQLATRVCSNPAVTARPIQ